MVCCRCNRTHGLCKGCVCAKMKVACSDCLPNRDGHCSNPFGHLPSSSPPRQSSSSQHLRTIECVKARPARNVKSSTSNGESSASDLSNFSRCRDSSSFDSPPDSSRCVDHAEMQSPSCVVDPIPSLPQFGELSESVFNWGSLDGPTCISHVHECYSEAVHWKPNLFRLPSGKVGEKFVKELTRLFNDYAIASALESIAIEAAHLLPLLVLQRSADKLKNKIIAAHIDRRLTLWHEGKFRDLLREGRDIQARLPSYRQTKTKDFQVSRTFADLMMKGKVNSAVRLLSNGAKIKAPLTLNSPADPEVPSKGSVKDVLAQKHPSPGPICPESILLRNTPPPVIMTLTFLFLTNLMAM